MRTDSSKFLESLCEYFANIGQTMSKNLLTSNSSFFKIHSKSCMQSFVMDEISTQDVSNSIDNIKPHFAPGVNGISPKFIKLAKPVLSPHFASPFNKCVQEIFPYDFKLAYIIPIPKTFSPKPLDHFRPMFLLPVFSKLFEKILKVKFSDFFPKNNILTSSQFGFKENNPTELAIISFYEK